MTGAQGRRETALEMPPVATQPREIHPVRAYRERRGLSLGEVAKKAGMSLSGLSRIETGSTSVPTALLIAALAQACEGEVSEIDIFRWHFACVCNYPAPLRAPMTAEYSWAWVKPGQNASAAA